MNSGELHLVRSVLYWRKDVGNAVSNLNLFLHVVCIAHTHYSEARNYVIVTREYASSTKFGLPTRIVSEVNEVLEERVQVWTTTELKEYMMVHSFSVL